MPESIETIFMVKLSPKGKVVIPKYIRRALDLDEGDELILIPTKDGIIVKRSSKGAVGLRGLLKGLDVDIAECEAILGEGEEPSQGR